MAEKVERPERPMRGRKGHRKVCQFSLQKKQQLPQQNPQHLLLT